jgi:cyclomaltodextrinase / maltogenic alpha-amylase / neopullulanase
MKKINQHLLLSVFLLSIIGITFSCKVAPPTFPVNKQQARTAPDWIINGIIYQIQPRAFTPEGTLKAATKKLSTVAELGMNIVYLCAVFVADDDMDQAFWSPRQKASGMNSPYNPYRMKDYYHVDPEYGTDNDLKDFINEAHRLDLRVMLDMVYYHCGPTAVFIKDNPNFIKHDKDGKVVNAAWSFPALNYDNPKLREYLWKNMEYWVNDFDVDGFRCDVADRIPLDFWETARERLEKIRPDIGILAEGQNRVENQNKAFDVSYSYTWYHEIRKIYENGQSVSSLRNAWDSLEAAFPRGARLIRFIDNHDITNDAFHNRIEKIWGTKRVNAALVIAFTFDGLPFIYNGQEVADTSRHSIFGRLPINWAGGKTQVGQDRFSFIQKLSVLRSTEPSLTQGKLEWIDNDAPDEVLSYQRTIDEERILTVINLTERSVKIKLKGISKKESKSFTPLLLEGIKGNPFDGFELQGYGLWVGKITN